MARARRTGESMESTKRVRMKVSFTYVLERAIPGGRLPRKFARIGDEAGVASRFVRAGLASMGVKSGSFQDVAYEVGVVQEKGPRKRPRK